jgi:hypothetical protein
MGGMRPQKRKAKSEERKVVVLPALARRAVVRVFIEDSCHFSSGQQSRELSRVALQLFSVSQARFNVEIAGLIYE